MKIYLLSSLALINCLSATELPSDKPNTNETRTQILKSCNAINWKQLTKDITRNCSCNDKNVADDESTKACACSHKPKKDGSDDEATKACACSHKPKKDLSDLNLEKVIAQTCVLNKQTRNNKEITQNTTETKECDDSGELFVQSAANMLQIVQGGIVAHNSGKLESGLPYIFNGISGLVTLISRSANPEQTLNDVINFMKTFETDDYDKLLNLARSQAITLSNA